MAQQQQQQQKQRAVQVIDGEGGFHGDELAAFIRDSGLLASSRTNYQVVAIMGPQSSGKSTLMNYLVRRSWVCWRGACARRQGAQNAAARAPPSFSPHTVPSPHTPQPLPQKFGTGFQEMDAMSGRQQTTKGVWIARSPKLDDPATLVLDLEGSDGRERGEDDTNFERQVGVWGCVGVGWWGCGARARSSDDGARRSTRPLCRKKKNAVGALCARRRRRAARQRVVPRHRARAGQRQAAHEDHLPGGWVCAACFARVCARARERKRERELTHPSSLPLLPTHDKHKTRST